MSESFQFLYGTTVEMTWYLCSNIQGDCMMKECGWKQQQYYHHHEQEEYIWSRSSQVKNDICLLLSEIFLQGANLFGTIHI